jgi:uncharacterized lipoprotein
MNTVLRFCLLLIVSVSLLSLVSSCSPNQRVKHEDPLDKFPDRGSSTDETSLKVPGPLTLPLETPENV